MRNLRDKLTYANVLSTLCLFMLLGGGAYAASQLPKNSVGAKQLKNGAVTAKKIKDESIGTKELTPATLSALKGAKGDAGPAGAQGPRGTTNSGAYATVVAEVPPVFIGAHPGFAAVERFPHETEAELGIYCLTPTAGTDIAHPIASADGKNSSGEAFFVDAYSNGGVVKCDEGELEVHTYEMQKPNGEEAEEPFVPLPSNDASFTVFAPTP